jgi:hypothetical protein
MAFRTTPILGPDLTQTGEDYYWDGIASVDVDGNAVDPSYQLGTRVTGSDGHDYTHVTAGEVLAADDRVNINETTWVATKNGTGSHQATVAVASGDAFQAKKYTA